MWKETIDKLRDKLTDKEIEMLNNAYLKVTKRIEKAWDEGYKAGESTKANYS